MFYFGEARDDAQLLTTRRCAVPVGVECAECCTPVYAGQGGVILTRVDRHPDELFYVNMLSRHRECHLLAVMHERHGRCYHIYGHADPDARRRAALELWERVNGR